MISSLAYIILIGLFFGKVFERISLPRIIGMILTGILIGPKLLNLLDENILLISKDLRQVALIIILIRAGLSLDITDLKRVGRPAVLMAFIPATFEILAYTLIAPLLLPISHVDACLMGTVLGAVSPAVVVPKMVKLIEEGYGKEKAIPQMILAGASGDDIFVIVLFTSVLSMALGKGVNLGSFVDIPISIVLGIGLGLLAGKLLLSLFDLMDYGEKDRLVELIILLGSAFLLMAIENLVKPWISISGLLSIISMAMVLNKNLDEEEVSFLSDGFNKLWKGAEIFLFVLVGAAVDISYTLTAGPQAVLLIFIALLVRSLGVILSLVNTPLKPKEKLFTTIAYIPKATVQAAIGSVPLAMGLEGGQIILSVAVLSILITAPLGAIGIDKTYKKLLTI